MNKGWTQYNLGQIVDFLDGRRKPLKEADRSKRPGPFPYFGATGVIDYVDDYLFDEEIILLSEDRANILSRQLPMAIRVKGKCWVNNLGNLIISPCCYRKIERSTQLSRWKIKQCDISCKDHILNSS